jgi:hypothetical protein
MEEGAYADVADASGGELEENEKTGFACGVKLGCTADVMRKKFDTLPTYFFLFIFFCLFFCFFFLTFNAV